jgi:hypothetical protein
MVDYHDLSQFESIGSWGSEILSPACQNCPSVNKLTPWGIELDPLHSLAKRGNWHADFRFRHHRNHDEQKLSKEAICQLVSVCNWNNTERGSPL